MEKQQSNFDYLGFLAPWILDNWAFSGFGGHFQKHQEQVKTQSRGQDKDENVYESNSAQSLSLAEVPAATLLCIRLSLTKFMAISPPVIPVMGCNPGVEAVSVY